MMCFVVTHIFVYVRYRAITYLPPYVQVYVRTHYKTIAIDAVQISLLISIKDVTKSDTSYLDYYSPVH